MRTLEEQFDDAEKLALRQFPGVREEFDRLDYHIELLKEIARGLAYRMVPLEVRAQVSGEIADELEANRGRA